MIFDYDLERSQRRFTQQNEIVFLVKRSGFATPAFSSNIRISNLILELRLAMILIMIKNVRKGVSLSKMK